MQNVTEALSREKKLIYARDHSSWETQKPLNAPY